MTKEVTASRSRDLRALARLTRSPHEHAQGREQLIRFLDSYGWTEGNQGIVDSLCVHFGLYPYVSTERATLSSSEALAYELHRPGGGDRDQPFVFHADQAAVYFRLLDGESIILSAPTSFGKSAILDAVVAKEKWHTIVVIVPTVALIDEIRRRLVRFSDRYTVITHPTQEQAEKNIFVLTQERFLELPKLPKVDFFMIDEFYKLGTADPAQEQRMSLLNIAWNRLRSTEAQYYLTGPNVDRLHDDLDEELHSSLTVSDFKTVAADVVDRSHVSDEDRLSDMEDYWPMLQDSTLVFVSAPTRAEKNAVDIAGFESQERPSEFALQVADWLAEEFHPSWRLVESLRGGVGTHTGPMPRSIQRAMIRLFGEKDISTLVCTTTLIEGVNTSAKNVIIFDKKSIANQ